MRFTLPSKTRFGLILTLCLVASAALPAAACACGSPIPFVRQHDITTAANGAHSVVAADLDGDGDIDLVSANSEEDTIAWYTNDGNGTFTNGTDITTDADSVHTVAAEDLDGDGDIDLASASFLDDTIAWYENDGDGTFTTGTDITTDAEGAYFVTAADLDGDGDIDLVSANSEEDTIAWYTNDGTGTFTTGTDITTDADGAHAVAAEDLDGDGDIDLASASYLDDTIAWYENDGDGRFSDGTDITTDADGARSVIAADLDGDDDIDLASASYLDDTIAWYENDGDGGFTVGTDISWADGIYSIASADLDSDGDIDLASVTELGNRIAWYENDGAGTFSSFVIADGDAAVISADDLVGLHAVAAADFDGDNDVDLVSASYHRDAVTWYRNDMPHDPIVDAAGPYTVEDGQTVTLTASGSDPDGGAVTYGWDLDGDTAFDDAIGTSVTYDSTVHGDVGANTVTVRVVDDETVSATDTAIVTITAPPTVDAGGPYSVQDGQTVTVTATGLDPDGGTVQYFWNLNDDGFYHEGTGASVAFDSNLYGHIGDNTITVIAVDDESTSATDTATVTITERPFTPAPVPPPPAQPTPTEPGPSDPPVEPTPPMDPRDVERATNTDDAIEAADSLSTLRFDDAVDQTFAQATRRTADFVVLARVDLYADALGGSVLTGNAPLLYTQGEVLDPRTALEIDRVLQPGGTVYLLGGTAALSDTIDGQLTDAGFTTIRLAGASRVETALAIADTAVELGLPTGADVALARADSAANNPTAAWADAITAGGWAADTGQPILLTQTDALHPAVAAWLANHPTLSPTALGGTAALADVTVTAAGATRVTGKNRYETAAQIAAIMWDGQPTSYQIANGTATDAWTYTLAAAGVAADMDQPTLLVHDTRIPDETHEPLCQTGTRAPTVVIGPDRMLNQDARAQLTNPCP